MPSAATAPLVDALRQYRLLEPEQLDEVRRTLQARFPDPKSLVKELIKRNWLTPFQGNQVLQGKGQELLLGSYVLQERLGEGGMGQVFKAKNWKLGRIVALKLIRKERLANPDSIRRFQREARAAAALSHTNIVRAIDADEIDGTHLLVMELVDGATDLAKLVKEKGPLPVPLACACIRQAALGLQHAFERGLVHRDIKPHNLLLAADGATLKVLDMGLARLDQGSMEDDKGSTMTKDGVVMGTPDYIAPEQALASHTVDIRADLYSLGCTLYFLLTGQVPFPGGSLTEKLIKHQLNDPVPVERLRPDIPPGLASIVRRMMAKKPEDRYKTPAEVAAALLPGLGGVPAPPPAIQTDQTLVEPIAVPIVAVPKPVDTAADTFNSAFAQLDTGLSKSKPPEPPPWVPYWASLKAWLFSAGTWLTEKPRRLGMAVGGAVFTLFAVMICGSMLSRPTVPNKTKDDDPPKKTIAKNPKPKNVEDVKEIKDPPSPLDGKWYYIGPFDNTNWRGFDTAFPPEKEINLAATYKGKFNRPVQWKEYPDFQLSYYLNFLPLFAKQDEKEWACIYLYHEIDSPEAAALHLSLGSDDSLTIWLNQDLVLNKDVKRAVMADDDFVTLKLKPGKNQLLVKICQSIAQWGFYISPQKSFFYEEPGFESWVKATAALPANKKLDAVVEKLKALNYTFDGKVTHQIEKDEVIVLHILTDQVRDLSPLQALKGLKKLWSHGSGHGLGRFWDLKQLKGLPLEDINFGYNNVADLTPLQGMPLALLHFGGTKVTDLTPIKGLPLTTLWFHDNQIADLKPAAGMQLTRVHCWSTKITDFSVLKNMPLKNIWCNFRADRDADVFRGIKTLETINDRPVAQVWKEYDAQQAAFQTWCDKVAAMPADGQVEAVVAKLKEVNPGFNSQVSHTVADGVVTGLEFATDGIHEIYPLQALKGLKRLKCRGNFWTVGGLQDLSGLKGLSLVELDCENNQIAKLAPLQGMSLTRLHCQKNNITDFFPLKGMPLKDLWCDFRTDRDAAILRSIPTLVTINNKPTRNFWLELEAKKPGR